MVHFVIHFFWYILVKLYCTFLFKFGLLFLHCLYIFVHFWSIIIHFVVL